MALKPNKRLFAEEYIKTWNASEAARRAGYSEATAQEQGSRLLKEPEIEEYIQSRISEVAMQADEVLLRLADHARGSIEEFIDIGCDEARLAEIEIELEKTKELARDGDLLDSVKADLRKEISRLIEVRERFLSQVYRLNLDKAERNGKLHLVKKLKQPEKGGVELELHDPQTALVHLGRHHKLFTDKMEHTGKDGEPLFKAYGNVNTDEV